MIFLGVHILDLMISVVCFYQNDALLVPFKK